jgi:hypothetical protein
LKNCVGGWLVCVVCWLVGWLGCDRLIKAYTIKHT